MKNLSVAKRRKGHPSPGAWINLPELHSAELMARMDFDWLCFDLQHGLMSYSHLLALIPAISGTDTTPIVRVASNHSGEIGRALDACAHGVIVPMVNTAAEAQRAVEACRYPPDGSRSCGPVQGAMPEGFHYLKTANGEIACIAMIETREKLENVEAIAATKGLDAIFVGPVDLCYGVGIAPGDFESAAFIDAIDRIKAAVAKAGCALGMFGYTPEIAEQALQDGFQFVPVGTDIGFFRQGASAGLSAAARATDGSTALEVCGLLGGLYCVVPETKRSHPGRNT